MICQVCKGLSSPRRCDKVTHSRAPLDSTVNYPITRSPNKHHETGKIENLSRSYLYLAHSTWARWWWSCPCPPQVGTPFLIVLTPSYSSRHPCNRLNSLMTNLWITPWTSWSSLIFFIFFLFQPKPHTRAYALLLISTLTPTYGSSTVYGQIL